MASLAPCYSCDGLSVIWTDCDEWLCLACAWATLAHGHAHVHDDPDDCALGGTVVGADPEGRAVGARITLCCDNPAGV